MSRTCKGYDRTEGVKKERRPPGDRTHWMGWADGEGKKSYELLQGHISSRMVNGMVKV